MPRKAMGHLHGAIVGLSLACAIGISLVALLAVFLRRSGATHLRKIASACGVGAAMAITHYTGGAAASVTDAHQAPSVSYATNVSSLGTPGIVLVVLMVLGILTLTSALYRLVREPSRSVRMRIRGVRIRAARTGVAAALSMLVFEATKQALYPTITLRTSHSITIAFASVLTAGLSYIILRREERIRSDLAAHEERYRLLFERSLAGIFRTTLEGRALDCNEACCHILGYASREELLADSAFNVYVNPIDRVKFTTRLQSQKVLSNFEHCLQRKDGSPVWVLENATLFEMDEPADAIIEGTIIDISERRRAEEDLHRLAAIVRCSDDGIISIDTEGIVETWNSGAERIYGYSAGEIVGAPIRRLAAPDQAEQIRGILEKIQRGQEVTQFETVHQRKDGQRIDIALTASPIKDAEGNVVGASAIARNITEGKRAEEALRQSENEYRLLFESCPMPMWVFDQRTLAFLEVNEAAVRHYGFSRREFLSMSIADIRPAEDIPKLLRHTAKPIRGLQEAEVWRHRKKDGTIMDVEIVSHDLDFHGINAELVVAHDITQRKQAEEGLRLAEEKYRGIFEDAVIGIFQATPEGRPININRALAQIHGYDSPDHLLAEVSNVVDELFLESGQMAGLRRELETKGVVRDVELEFYRRDRSKRSARANVRAIHDSHGRVTLIEGTIEDITDRKRAEERVQFLAYYDALTGLPNRTLLNDRLGKALANARRRGEKVALLFLDLDGFKTINDSLGHSFGDLLLQDVGERLKKWARAEDTVARIGGDEFVIMLTGTKDIPSVAVAAERIMDTMTAEFVVQGRRFIITCSVGISVYPDHGTDGEALIKNADAAMYAAKDSGRNAFRFFAEEMNAQVVERLAIEHNLRSALEKREFFLVYQPQADIATGKITGMEALLRWKHPELGLVPPDRFIPVAENTALILPIGTWVLQTACSAARKWQDEGLLGVSVAVNVSAVQFRQKDFLDVVRRMLQEAGLASQFLELELTESLLLSNGDLTLPVLRELKAMGVKLAIDDFGTGYSSLSYLRHFPVNKLKIDRSFIRTAVVNPDDAAITAAIISMGKSLNLKVIAEGVETEAQMSFLRSQQCDGMQGFYFSMPLTLKEILGELRKKRAQARSAHGG